MWNTLNRSAWPWVFAVAVCFPVSLSALERESLDCKDVKVDPASIRAGVDLLCSDGSGILATYKSETAVLVLEVQYKSTGVLCTMSDQDGQILSSVALPDRPAGEPKSSSPLFGLGSPQTFEQRNFSDLELPAKVRLLEAYVQFADGVAKLLPKETPAVAGLAIQAQPHLLGLSFERDPGTPQQVGKLVLHYNDGVCAGACGPGCGWCACGGTPLCVCYTNSFCQWHDKHCGAWEDFFNCRFDI